MHIINAVFTAAHGAPFLKRAGIPPARAPALLITTQAKGPFLIYVLLLIIHPQTMI
jgi:hypothetical protein